MEKISPNPATYASILGQKARQGEIRPNVCVCARERIWEQGKGMVTLREVFLDRISPRKAHASIPYVLPDKYTSSTGFSIKGVTYGTSDSRVSNLRVAALMVKI